MKEKDFPFVTKEVTFGNIYDNNDGEATYVICQEGCGMEMNREQLSHLHTAIGKILKEEKKGGGK